MDLPNDVLLRIIDFLPESWIAPEHRLSLARTCRRFFVLLSDNRSVFTARAIEAIFTAQPDSRLDALHGAAELVTAMPRSGRTGMLGELLECIEDFWLRAASNEGSDEDDFVMPAESVPQQLTPDQQFRLAGLRHSRTIIASLEASIRPHWLADVIRLARAARPVPFTPVAQRWPEYRANLELARAGGHLDDRNVLRELVTAAGELPSNLDADRAALWQEFDSYHTRFVAGSFWGSQSDDLEPAGPSSEAGSIDGAGASMEHEPILRHPLANARLILSLPAERQQEAIRAARNEVDRMRPEHRAYSVLGIASTLIETVGTLTHDERLENFLWAVATLGQHPAADTPALSRGDLPASLAVQILRSSINEQAIDPEQHHPLDELERRLGLALLAEPEGSNDPGDSVASSN